jgi:hypothetical protein
MKSTTKDQYLHVVSLYIKTVIRTKDDLAKRNRNACKKMHDD